MNVERVKKAIADKSCNALPLKVNQIGFTTKALAGKGQKDSLEELYGTGDNCAAAGAPGRGTSTGGRRFPGREWG